MRARPLSVSEQTICQRHQRQPGGLLCACRCKSARSAGGRRACVAQQSVNDSLLSKLPPALNVDPRLRFYVRDHSVRCGGRLALCSADGNAVARSSPPWISTASNRRGTASVAALGDYLARGRSARPAAARPRLGSHIGAVISSAMLPKLGAMREVPRGRQAHACAADDRTQPAPWSTWPPAKALAAPSASRARLAPQAWQPRLAPQASARKACRGGSRRVVANTTARMAMATVGDQAWRTVEHALASSRTLCLLAACLALIGGHGRPRRGAADSGGAGLPVREPRTSARRGPPKPLRPMPS